MIEALKAEVTLITSIFYWIVLISLPPLLILLFAEIFGD